jgi:hypothetical protein
LPVLLDKPQEELESLLVLVGQREGNFTAPDSVTLTGSTAGYYLLPYKVFDDIRNALSWKSPPIGLNFNEAHGFCTDGRNYWEVEEIFHGGPLTSWLEDKLRFLMAAKGSNFKRVLRGKYKTLKD